MKKRMGIRRIATVTVAAASLIGAVLLPSASAGAQSTSACVAWHVVQRGETLYRISRMYNTTVSALQTLNGISNSNRIYAGQTLCITQSVSGGRQYIVQPGDRLGDIARAYGVDLTVLARVNGISNINRIYVGQVLVIPDFTIQ